MKAGARGVFVVLEGADGTGKSTQLARLAARFEAAGREALATREPYDCEAGRRIRAMARSGELVSAEQELAWFWEQRAEHVRDVIEPALQAGRDVLCDRYYFSSVAYQGARGLDPVRILAESEAAFPRPDLALWLDLPVEAALARARGRGGPDEPVFEEATRQRAVVEIYRSLVPDHLTRIDASGDETVISERVASAVRERLGLLV